MLVSRMVHRADSQPWSGSLLQRHTRVICLTQCAAGQVHPSRTGGQPAVFDVQGRIILVLPGPHAGFTDVIHARPYEVANQPRFAFGELAEAVCIVAEGFGAENQSIRILLQVVNISLDAIVVAGHVHRGERISRHPIAKRQRSTGLHEIGAQHAGHIVEELTADSLMLVGGPSCGTALLGGLGLLRGLLVGILAKADRRKKIEEDVHTAGDRTGVVKRMQIFSHRTRERNTALLRRFRHLITGGVQYHTRMVAILHHHVGKIPTPPFVEIINVIMLRLMNIPMVDILIHHQHTKSVTRLQQCFRTRIVRGTDGIVAIRLHQTNLALLGVGIRACAKHAVVMMDARALDDHALAVDQQSPAPPFERTDTERGRSLVGIPMLRGVTRGAHVQFRMVHGPWFRVGNAELIPVYPSLAWLRDTGCDPTRHVGDFNVHTACRSRFDLDADTCGAIRRIRGDSTHEETVHCDMLGGRRPQRDGTVDTGSGVPTGIRLIGIACNHANLIVFTETNAAGQINVKIGVSVWAKRRLLTVHPHLGMMIDALEFKQHPTADHIPFRHEMLDVFIIATFEPAGIQSTCRERMARLIQHRIMWNRNGGPILIGVKMAIGPACIEICCLHDDS